jgi:CysZ protein
MTGDEAMQALGDPSAPGFVARAAVGWRALGVGFRFAARHPSLWPWMLLPFAVGLVLVAAATGLAWLATAPLLAWLTGVDRTWEQIAVAVVPLLFALVVGALTAGVAWLCLNWLAIPFHEELSQRVEWAVTGTRHRPTWSQWLAEGWWGLVHGAFTFGVWLLAMALSLALQLIPVLGSALGFAVGALASAILLARETMDGPMSRRRFGYGRKLRVISENAVVSLTHGAWVALFMWVPLLNVVVLPFAVVGGTLLFLRLERGGRLPLSPSGSGRTDHGPR